MVPSSNYSFLLILLGSSPINLSQAITLQKVILYQSFNRLLRYQYQNRPQVCQANQLDKTDQQVPQLKDPQVRVKVK
jgi:hypothetical protein